MWIIILAVILATLFYFAAIKPLQYWEERGIPNVKAWPVAGNLVGFIFHRRAFVHIVEDLYKTFSEKRYFGFFNLTKPTLVIRDLDLIKRITVKDFDAFPQHRQVISEDIDPLWSKNLFGMTGGERWQSVRATLSPSFTGNKMKMMFELMKKCSKQFSDHFLKQGGTVTVEMKDAYSRFTNDVIATTAFGVNCDSLEHRENEFYLMGKEATTFTASRILFFLVQTISPALGKLLGFTMFSKTVDKFFRGVIKETLKVREEQGIVRPDMIHLLMEARKGRLKHEDNVADSGFAVVQESELGKTQKKQKVELTDEDITAQALIFFFAGFDTSSTMMSFATYELAINPDVQEKLRKEVDEALGKSKGEVTYEMLMGMKYLDMVLSEALRKWPPFPFIDRQVVKPYTIEPEQPGETLVRLELGDLCFVPVYPIQRDPQYYPNPDKFDPERFSEENKHNIKPFTYLPFGSGPRNCIGSRFALLEVKLVIVEILSKFEIVPVEKTLIPMVIGKKNFFNPVPDEGFWLGLKPRINAL